MILHVYMMCSVYFLNVPGLAGVWWTGGSAKRHRTQTPRAGIISTKVSCVLTLRVMWQLIMYYLLFLCWCF